MCVKMEHKINSITMTSLQVSRISSFKIGTHLMKCGIIDVDVHLEGGREREKQRDRERESAVRKMVI